MIIFDLDGTLANCEHRRHFVDPLHPININNAEILSYDAMGNLVKAIGWKPDWRAFYDACDKDTLILPVAEIWGHYEVGLSLGWDDLQIWSGRCESVRKKTVRWLEDNLNIYNEELWEKNLKMRPIGDYTPDDQLKERWLDEALIEGKRIEFVFDDRPKVIRMWRRRGIFVFDCNQIGEEF